MGLIHEGVTLVFPDLLCSKETSKLKKQLNESCELNKVHGQNRAKRQVKLGFVTVAGAFKRPYCSLT